MSTISVRVTLLLLATVMFAAVWSNDHKPEPAKLHTVVAYEFPAACPVDVIEPASHEVIQAEPGKELVSEAGFLIGLVASDDDADELKPLKADRPRTINVTELPFPLPGDLTAGEYRVVDRFGNVESLAVTANDLASWGISAGNQPRHAYQVDTGETRWHFIRIEQSVVPDPTQAEIAAAWKSVFRFAGRKVAPAIDKASAPIQRWLDHKTDLSGETRKLR